MRTLFILFALALCFSASAQHKKYVKILTSPDTLTLSSAAGSEYIYFGGTSAATATEFEGPGTLAITAKADSLSGQTNARLVLEYCYNPPTCSWWVKKDSVTINGPNPVYLNVEDTNFEGGAVRLRQTAGSSTQSNKFQGVAIFKRAYQ